MTELRERLLAAFQVEHREHLKGIRDFLIAVEQPDAAAADVSEAFRRAHSLKSAARVCGFNLVEAVAKRLETFFGRMRKGGLELSRSQCEAIRKALSVVEDWISQSAASPSAREPVEIIQQLESALVDGNDVDIPSGRGSELSSKLLAAFQIEQKEHVEAIRSILADIERGVSSPGRVDEAFRRAHSLKGAARVAERHATEEQAHRLESLFAQVREGTTSLDERAIQAIIEALDTIEDNASTPPESKAATEPLLGSRAPGSSGMQPQDGAGASAPSPAAESIPASLPSLETLRVSAADLDRLLRSTGQLQTVILQQNVVARDLGRLAREFQVLEKQCAAMRHEMSAAVREAEVSPRVNRVFQQLDQVERLVRNVAKDARTVRRWHQQSNWSLESLGGQLQQDVRRVQMVFAGSVFQDFRKMMRDLARAEGKKIDFRVHGLDIAVDRRVLQLLKDPLMHILRNALSHGIELPDERQRQGKDAVGRVSLDLTVAGNRLNIRVEDDGRGLDFVRVAAQAVRNGMLTEAEAATASQERLTQMLFQPGFSTSTAITGLSGRGMGLSVVSEIMIRLQGELEIRPREGSGTLLTLAVPLSFSTQRLLLLACQGQKLAVPLNGIERLLRVALEEIDSVAGQPTLQIDGKSVPVVGLATLLDMNEAAVEVDGNRLPLVLLRSGSKRVAAIVDEFLEERDSLIHEFNDMVADLGKLAGGIFLEDGSVCVVVNVPELIRTFAPSERVLTVQSPAAPAVKGRSMVLVVDDSLTTRTLEKSILETHGYDVRIAVDGMEALTKLQQESFDLVITDVQMPRLDGLQLLEAMKQNSRWAQIPVIMVTSMGSPEDQERGMALGADAYIVKRKFDHDELLETIRQII